MSYYDDWVEPNGFFKGGARLMEKCRQAKMARLRSRVQRRRELGQKCPYCGRKYIGLQDHINAKHPNGFDEN